MRRAQPAGLPPTRAPAEYRSIYLSIYPSIYLIHISIPFRKAHPVPPCRKSFCLSIYLSRIQSIYLSLARVNLSPLSLAQGSTSAPLQSVYGLSSYLSLSNLSTSPFAQGSSSAPCRASTVYLSIHLSNLSLYPFAQGSTNAPLQSVYGRRFYISLSISNRIYLSIPCAGLNKRPPAECLRPTAA